MNYIKKFKYFEDYLNDEPSVDVKYNRVGWIKSKILSNNIFKNEYDFINEIALKLNVKIIKLLNYGSMGVAIELEGEKVMKLTTDTAEIINSYELINNNSKHIVKIYSVHIIKPNSFGVIIMDKVNKNDDIVKIMSVIQDKAKLFYNGNRIFFSDKTIYEINNEI